MEIRYTRGPADLWLGDVHLLRGAWCAVVDAIAEEASRKARREEYGFEVRAPRKDKSRNIEEID